LSVGDTIEIDRFKIVTGSERDTFHAGPTTSMQQPARSSKAR
jgi:hypothetical protein